MDLCSLFGAKPKIVLNNLPPSTQAPLPVLYQGWSMWPIEYKGNDSVRCLSLAHQRYYHFYRTSQCGPHESFCLVLFNQQNETKISSEAKESFTLWSKNGEVPAPAKPGAWAVSWESCPWGDGWRSCRWGGASRLQSWGQPLCAPAWTDQRTKIPHTATGESWVPQQRTPVWQRRPSRAKIENKQTKQDTHTHKQIL